MVRRARQVPRTCTYARWTGSNLEEIQALCTEAYVQGDFVITSRDLRAKVASVGQIITVGEDGQIRIYSNPDFEIKYDKIEEPK